MKKILFLTTLVTSLVSLNAAGPAIIDELALSIAQMVHAGRANEVANRFRQKDALLERAVIFAEKLEETSTRAAFDQGVQAGRIAAGAFVAGVATGLVIKVAHDRGNCTIL